MTFHIPSICQLKSVGLGKHYPDFLSYISSSNDALIFYYMHLDTLLKSNFKHIRYLTFEDIVSNNFEEKLSSFFGVCVISALGEDANKKVKSRDGTYVSAPKVIYDFRRVRKSKSYLRLKQYKFIHSIFKRIDSVLNKKNFMIVDKPNQSEYAFFEKRFEESFCFHSSKMVDDSND